MRRPMRRIGKRREEYFAVAQLLCLRRNIENLSAIQEKNGYLFRQRGNERFVGLSGQSLPAWVRLLRIDASWGDQQIVHGDDVQ
jgi:hypothetical protein